MPTEIIRHEVSMLRGILLGTLDQYDPNRPDQVWRLYNEASLPIDCLIPSADLLHSLLSQPLTTLNLQLAGWQSVKPGAQGGPLPVLTEAWADDHPDDALHCLPLDICPVEGTYMGILELIETVYTPPLYRLLWRVFREREIVARYWTMPASARHHHAFAGGLATHSFEVARDLADQAALGPHERELGIAAGLLHDIGKVWSYTPDMFLNTAARAMGHELLGLSRLERELKVLEGEWPDGAYTMRVLLSGCGRMRRDGSMPSALVARLKAADQRSCELERNSRNQLLAWKPDRWQPPKNLEPNGPDTA